MEQGTLNDLTTERVSVASLKPHPDNPRRGKVEAIKESLEATGQYRPIVVSRATGHVLAGNHTLKAAIALGWADIQVTYLDDLTPQQEKRILLADNRTADMGTYDDEALLKALQALVDDDDDLIGTGYTFDDYEDLQLVLEGAAEVAAPATDAHYNEDEAQMAARQERLGNYQSLQGQGLAEVILILTNEKKEQLHLWCERLRQEWGSDLTNGEVVHAALGRLVEKANAPAPAPAPAAAKAQKPTSGIPTPFVSPS